MKHCIALVLLCLVQAATAADKTAPIYRCGNSYSNTPCAQGAAVPIDDSRTPAQKAQSEKVLAQDKAQAQALEKERLAQEKLAAQDAAAAAKAATNKPAAPKTESPAPKHSKKKKKAEPAFFTATSETPAKLPKTKTRTKSSATSAQP